MRAIRLAARRVRSQSKANSPPWRGSAGQTSDELAPGHATRLRATSVSMKVSTARKAPPPMKASTARKKAQVEGLTLVPSVNEAGFKHVSLTTAGFKAHHRSHHPYRVDVLGVFDTAEEAALAVARRLGPKASAAEGNGKAWEGAATTNNGCAELALSVEMRDDAVGGGAVLGKRLKMSPTSYVLTNQKSHPAVETPLSMQQTPPSMQPRSKQTVEALAAVLRLKTSDRSLTAKQVHALLPNLGFELSLAVVKRLCSEASRKSDGFASERDSLLVSTSAVARRRVLTVAGRTLTQVSDRRSV